MRDLAAHFTGERLWWAARLGEVGSKRGTGEITYLLTNVATTGGVVVMDHTWIKTNPAILSVGARIGQRVRFSAVVRRYRRLDDTEDWGLFEIQDFCCKKRRR